MKTKSFKMYLEKRLNQDEIAKLEEQALLEKQALQTMQNDVSKIIAKYMAQEKIGFNELVRRLGASPSQLTKIRQGKANLTIATLAHLFALLKKQPRIIARA